MACALDSLQVGVVVMMGEGSVTYCQECNTEHGVEGMMGIYRGHYEKASGRYAKIELFDLYQCPTCGGLNNEMDVPCEEPKLFVQQEVEKEIKV